MKLKDVRKCYDYHTEKAGDVGRQLAFGGIAVVWLLHGAPDVLSFPEALLWALVGFLLALGFDFLHYLVASAIWGVFGWVKERRFQADVIDPESSDGDFLAPDPINALALLFYWAKAVALVGGAVALGVYLSARITAA